MRWTVFFPEKFNGAVPNLTLSRPRAASFERERLEKVILEDPGVIEEYVNVTTCVRHITDMSREAREDVLAIWKAVSLHCGCNTRV